MSLDYATALDVGARKRDNDGINEDCVGVAIVEDGHLDEIQTAGAFVLADGAGGEGDGDIASRIATTVISRRLTDLLWDEPSGESGRDLYPTDAVLDAITDAIQAAHTKILERIGELDLSGAYTTVVAAVKFGDRLYYGWVGDSRAYLINTHPERDADHNLTRLTRDHSLVEQLLERGQIDEIEAHVHRQGNRVTRALGGTADEDPETSTVLVDTGHVQLYGDDVVLMTSDGLIDAYADAPRLHDAYREADDTAAIEAEILTHAVTDDEIRDEVIDADSLDDAADRLISLANDRGGKDNLSIILCRDGGLDPSPATGVLERDRDETAESPANATTTLRCNDP